MGTVMNTFGDQLRQERERRNVALDEIARLTKIRMRYLQALEDGQHERLPGIVFAKGYVRAYAETIGADAERLVGAYVAEQRSLGRLETEASQENVLEALAAAVETDREMASKRGKAAIVVAVVVIGAAAGLWFGVRPMLKSEPTPATAATSGPPERAIETGVANALDLTTTSEADTTGGPASSEAGSIEPEPLVTTVGDDAMEPSSARTIVATAHPEPVETATEPEAAPEPVETKPAAAPSVPAATIAEDMSVSEFGVGTDVEQRALVGEASEFETGTMVVFWNRVVGGEPGRHIRHVWFHEGSLSGTRELSIGAAHWRTYSKQTLRGDGTWTVEAQDEQGRVLARETFVATSRKL